MKLARPRPRPPRETIVSMIDVVFFLLVFFLLVGRYDASAPFDVAPPVSADGAPLPAGGVTISIARDGALALDGREMTKAEILSDIAATDAETRGLIRINAHEAARLKSLLPLVAELEKNAGAEVVLVVTPRAQ